MQERYTAEGELKGVLLASVTESHREQHLNLASKAAHTEKAINLAAFKKERS
jgi:hypothetical protein